VTDNIDKPASARIVQLAERVGEIIEITELSPDNGAFIGKRIRPDGHIDDYPMVKWWRQRVAQVPASIPALCAYLREARTRNVCLIRGAPANIERQRTRRQRAYEVKNGKDRGDHGFVDAPSKLFWFDVDGAPMKWKADPEGGVRNVVAQLGEPWAFDVVRLVLLGDARARVRQGQALDRENQRRRGASAAGVSR
jgi:hypothetical protein